MYIIGELKPCTVGAQTFLTPCSMTMVDGL